MTIPWQMMVEYDHWISGSADTASAFTKQCVEYERMCLERSAFTTPSEKKQFMEWYENWLLPHGQQGASE